jgi:hypothetical protein
VRAAAAALGMHHSTLQARHEALTNELGYDPRSLDGRARYRLARLLLRLAGDRADETPLDGARRTPRGAARPAAPPRRAPTP